MKDKTKVDELLKLNAKFSDLACAPNEYPESPNDEEIRSALNAAQDHRILDKDYNLIFHIYNSEKVDGDPGCGPVLFKDSYNWENEEYKGDYNMTVYSEIAKDAVYLACKAIHDSLPPEAQDFYFDALDEELQYNLDDDVYDNVKYEWASRIAPTHGDGREEERYDLVALLDKYEEDIKSLLVHGFRF